MICFLLPFVLELFHFHGLVLQLLVFFEEVADFCQKVRGSSEISLIWFTLISLAATAMILSSASPLSIICITPTTLASMMHRGTTVYLGEDEDIQRIIIVTIGAWYKAIIGRVINGRI